MPRRLQKTAADYLAIAVGPALIMTLVGSLVFFLLEVFYQGQYQARLAFILGAFVFAAVLIGRIAIESGTQRAVLFAAPLALLTALAIGKYVVHRGPLAGVGWFIDCGLLALIWWCAHRLTFDCTLIDEGQDASGEGLLQTIGWEAGAASSDPPFNAAASGADEKPRPHAPGLWVVYFSLAALPIFGVGQLLIPTASLARRQYVFWLMAVYVASGLGLLLITSFLGLRRYLRQRRVQMPPAMAATWVAAGASLALALMAFALLIPRPNAELAVSSLTGALTSPQKTASKHAPGQDGAKDAKSKARSKGGADPNSKTGGGQGKSTAKTGKGPRDGKGTKTKGPSGNGKQGGKTTGGRSEGKTGKTGPPGNEQNRAEQDETPRDAKPPSTTALERLKQAAGSSAALLKWLFYAVLIAAAAYCAWRYRAEIRAAWTQFLKDLRNLFRRGDQKQDSTSGGDDDGPPLERATPASRSFAEFADPFAGNLVGRMTPDELVAYTFAALEAWAREQGRPRGAEETPREFAAQLAAALAPLAERLRHLAELYSQVAYAPDTISAEEAESLRQLWKQLKQAGDRRP